VLERDEATVTAWRTSAILPHELARTKRRGRTDRADADGIALMATMTTMAVMIFPRRRFIFTMQKGVWRRLSLDIVGDAVDVFCERSIGIEREGDFTFDLWWSLRSSLRR